MVLADRGLEVLEIVEAISISFSPVVLIFNDYLGMRKLSARWMTSLLTINTSAIDQNFDRVLSVDEP